MVCGLGAGLRCIASSEDAARSRKGEPPADSGPLPADWNQGDDLYCLFYVHASSPGALFTVKSVVMDDMFLVSSALMCGSCSPCFQSVSLPLDANATGTRCIRPGGRCALSRAAHWRLCSVCALNNSWKRTPGPGKGACTVHPPKGSCRLVLARAL